MKEQRITSPAPGDVAPPALGGGRQRLPDLGLVRSADDRVLTGVAAGIGGRLGVDSSFVRAAFVVLALAGGAGVIAYLVAWSLSADPGPVPAHRRERTTQGAVALGFVVLGAMFVLRDVGLWFGSALVWPLALAAVGSAVIWARSDEAERTRLARLAARLPGDPLRVLFTPGPAVLVRVGIGGLLVLIGLVILVSSSAAIRQVGDVLIAVLVVSAGAALVLGPAVARLARQVTEERRARIRSQERADVAAHLHDSVLQTLALIQRASDPREMSTLARVQERELRAWLYGRPPTDEHQLLSAALGEVAGLVEQRYRTKIEVVVVGDTEVDARGRALVAAVGEALHNAALHSGTDSASVYAEITTDSLTAYVTDEGKGFEPGEVPAHRRGIADSIVGRVARHGGTASIVSEAGEGTEVHLQLPRNGS